VKKIHRTYLCRRQNTLLMFTNWYSSPSETGGRSSKRVEDGTYLQRKDGPWSLLPLSFDAKRVQWLLH
jgi:hypothetical protein